MPAGTYNITAVANETYRQTIETDAYTDHVGYSARLDVRAGVSHTDTLLLSLTSTPAAGLTLTSTGTVLRVAVHATAAQIATVETALNGARGHYSLRVTTPAGDDDQVLVGTFVVSPTPTPAAS